MHFVGFYYHFFTFLVYTVLNDLKQNKSNRYLNVFHHRPVAAALYRKVHVHV